MSDPQQSSSHPNSAENVVEQSKERTEEPLTESITVDPPSVTTGQVSESKPEPRPDEKVELEEKDCPKKLGFSFPRLKKWAILCVIFAIQVSMNFNASVYANAIEPLTKEFRITAQVARLGQMTFLVAYAFGSELWAPWSEEFGRRPVLQFSLLFVNIWQIPCALAPNFTTIIIGRFLGGLSSAGGSVTLGMVADMWDADDQQYAIAFIVFSSVSGSVVGPVVGGFIQTHLSWHWNFWVQLLFGLVVQLIHFVFVPETRSSVLLDREAKRLRKKGEPQFYGPGELKEDRLSVKEIFRVWRRPFKMFFTEPIVLWLSLLSGFSDALIFTFLDSYQPVFQQWGFTTIQIGLAFIPIMIGNVIGYLSFLPFIRRHHQIRRKNPDALKPEDRLYWLLYTAPLETIGLFGFAWTSLGPPHVHWSAPLVFSTLIAIANYSIYMATIDYMVASYGPYSASATGGNALARDLLAGVAALYSTPFYTRIGHKYKLEWPTTILGCLAFFVTIPIYIFYWKGPQIREKSPFAVWVAKGSVNGNETKKHPASENSEATGVTEAEAQIEQGTTPRGSRESVPDPPAQPEPAWLTSSSCQDAFPDREW